MRYRHIALAGLMCAWIHAAAVTVDNVAGTLCTILPDTSVSELTVTGTIDAADFEYIAHTLTSLRTLDLSQATVVRYADKPLLTGMTQSEADVLPDNALFGSTVTDLRLPLSLRAIGDHAFASSAITSITIPASVTSIGAGAFAGCNSLTELTLPASVTSLGSHLASGAEALTTVNIQCPVSQLPAHAFDRCHSLTSVRLRTTLQGIGDYAFNQCSSLTSFTFPSRLTAIGQFAFNGSGLVKADMSPAMSMSTIGDYAFAACRSLESVTIPASVSSIGTGAFYLDSSLTDITLPAAVTVISDLTFAGLENLRDTDGILNDNITEIGDYALARWSSVKTAHLPENLESLGDHAMERWTSLTALDARKTHIVPMTGTDVWDGVDQARVELKVDERDLDLYKEADQWSRFDIHGYDSKTVEIFVDPTDDGIRAYFIGHELHVLAEDIISRVTLYDASGMTLAGAEPADTAVVIDTDGMSTSLYIVSVQLEDGTVTSLKLLRR